MLLSVIDLKATGFPEAPGFVVIERLCHAELKAESTVVVSVSPK